MQDGGAGMSEAAGLRVGVDAGSTTWKAVAIDSGARVVAVRIEPCEPRVDEQTRRGLESMLRPLGGGRPAGLGATG